MTTRTQEDVAQLNIHSLTQTQYDGLETVSPTDLYIVDLELQKNAIVMTDEDGELTAGYTQVSFDDAATISLLNNTIYNSSAAISTLNITLPTTANVDFIAQITFTNNATSSAVITPSATVKWVGDECDEDYVFTPLTNYRYTIFITYDGLNWIGNVRGVK